MSIQPFTETDFDVFTIPGLEERMTALIENVRPKLTAIGQETAPFLSALCGEEMFVHVAKHARRTVNPPNDSWVAWAHHKRGYKAYPHFETGLFADHLYIQFAVIYESSYKAVFGEHLRQNLDMIKTDVPDHYFWTEDHISPSPILHRDMTDEKFMEFANRLERIKKTDGVCGLRIDKKDAVQLSAEKLKRTIEETLETLMPLYRIAF